MVWNCSSNSTTQPDHRDGFLRQGRPGQLENYPDATSHWVSGPGRQRPEFRRPGQPGVESNSADLALGTDATFALDQTHQLRIGLRLGSYVRHVGRVLRKGSYLDLETVMIPVPCAPPSARTAFPRPSMRSR
jgi:hypothetical protein